MKIQEHKIEKFAYFSLSHFTKNQSRSMELLKRVVTNNKRYPSVCTHLYGSYLKTDLFDNPVLVTCVTIHPDGSTYNYDDKIFLGKVIGFSHYPEEVLKPEEYADPDTQRVLYSDYFLNALH